MQVKKTGVKNVRLKTVYKTKILLILFLFTILLPLDWMIINSNEDLINITEKIVFANVPNICIALILLIYPDTRFLHYWAIRGIIWIIIFMLALSILGSMPSNDKPSWFFIKYIFLYISWLFLYDRYFFNKIFSSTKI